MLEMIMLMACTMPREELLEGLKQAITDYQINPSETNEKGIEFHAVLLVCQMQNKGGIDGCISQIKELKELSGLQKMMHNKN